MALHRDIFWVGRQWAVTGFGVQAVDQRLKGAFDIEIARLWDDDLPQRMRTLAWLRADDFENALKVAWSRFPEPPRRSLPLVESVMELIVPPASEPPKPEAEPRAVRIEADPPLRGPPKAAIAPIVAGLPSSEPAKAPMSRVDPIPAEREPVATDRPQAPSHPLVLRIEHVSARFLPRWRIRH